MRFGTALTTSKVTSLPFTIPLFFLSLGFIDHKSTPILQVAAVGFELKHQVLRRLLSDLVLKTATLSSAHFQTEVDINTT